MKFMATVRITCDTPEAQIRYTLDGNNPTETSSLYSSTLNITQTTTVKARAYKEGYEESDIASKEITILGKLPTPQIEINGRYLNLLNLTDFNPYATYRVVFHYDVPYSQGNYSGTKNFTDMTNNTIWDAGSHFVYEPGFVASVYATADNYLDSDKGTCDT